MFAVTQKAVKKRDSKKLEKELKTATSRRKKLKTKIKSFLLEYEEKHGKAPTPDEQAPIKSFYVERNDLEVRINSIKKELEGLKSGKGSKAQEESSADPNLTMSVMRKRRAEWLKTRFTEIQGELDNDFEEKPKASKWEMMRAILKPLSPKPSASATPASTPSAPLALPPGVTKSDLMAISVGDDYVQSSEAALRSFDMDTIVKSSKLTDPSLPADYVEEFQEEAPEAEIQVTSVPTSELVKREKQVEEQRLATAQAEVKKFKAREADIAFREDKARQRVKEIEDEAANRLQRIQADADADNKLHESRIARYFLQSKVMLEEKAMLKEKFGRLKASQTSGARRYALMWDRIPQPIEIRVHMMKSVSSKLRRGNYCLLVSMYSRLGGHKMSWTKFPSDYSLSGEAAGEASPMEDKSATTTPLHYSGKYYDRELRFNDSIFCLCPSPRDVSTANVLIFELYEMASSENQRDSVVAWGALPMCDQHFRIIHGRFRIPFLRGPIDRNIKKYETAERRYANDLAMWMSNLYIDVKHLEREFHDTVTQKRVDEYDYDVEFNYINKEIAPSASSVSSASSASSASSTSPPSSPRPDAVVNKGIKTNSSWQAKAATIFKKSLSSKSISASSKSPTKLRRRRRRKKQPPTTTTASNNAENSDEEYHSDYSDGEDGGRVLSKTDKSVLPGNEIVVDTNEMHNLKKKQDFPNWTDGGLGIKKTKTAAERHQAHVWHELTDSQEIELYTMAVANDPNLSYKASPDHILNRKLTYLFEELKEDLDTHSIFSVEFFLSLTVLLIALWLRMYFHYMAQWLFLKLNGIPLFNFQIDVFSIAIKYTSSNITDWVEVGVVAIGQLANTLIMSFATIVSLALSVALDSLPAIISKFVISFGAVTLLDPLFIFIVDVSKLNFDCTNRSPECNFDYTSQACNCVTGDAFKLWSRMARIEASGVTGAFYTFVIYAFTTLLSGMVLYNYILYAHMNGRMLDNVRRIHDPEENFFVPEDNEISMEALKNILQRARKWRGPGGTLRKVHVSEFTVTDSKDKNFTEVMTHITIFTTEVDLTKTLYRHFLRQHNGSIIEIDEEIMQHFSGQLALEKLMGQVQEEDKAVAEAEAEPEEKGEETSKQEKKNETTED